MPRLDLATERLLSGEIADPLTIRRKHYGATVCAALLGRRFILDLVKRS